MKLSQSQWMQARDFIYANGRLLDRRRYEYHFANGTAVSVLNALRPYQNQDGGFGNALEPDMRTPESQPIATEYALMIMDEVGLWDAEMLTGVLNYLRTIAKAEGGLPRATTCVNEYPHAPWWTTDEDHSGSLNPTGRILALLYKQQVITGWEGEEWFTKCVDFVWRSIPFADKSDYHDLIHCITFLEHTPDRQRASEIISQVDEWLQSPGTIELDPGAEGYVHKVLEWAPAPGSYAKKWIKDEDVRLHLEYLIRHQQGDGGWGMSFPALSPGNEAEWRSLITLDHLITLQAYGRP
ncbi:hypothetical protein GRF59_01935 [Paenibacillus sp. HJL G12]|uniref:Uncharacterized protein n=1 Tax=Paenibacillus dendrobii TaxID=2691084 RepID=A0A7X3LGP5_9BACL|nr:hypothetical protein [Paenibacillus dendrobii]MWV42379.1 hypothetical protein [Paenibacillus dendrobii]